MHIYLYKGITMKWLLLVLTLIPAIAQSRIEDNSFLLEEAYNQEEGVYQFIQKYQTFDEAGLYAYSFENEIPITDKVHQFSYEFQFARADGIRHGAISDVTLNYRLQPVNKNGFLLAERIGLIVPTGRVQKNSGNGVYGLEFMQSASIEIAEQWMNHWNFGFSVLPNAKTYETAERRTLSKFTAGTSVIYLLNDKFNILLEGLLTTAQAATEDGSKEMESFLILNPGIRFSLDYAWKDTQLVPGISFPTEMLNGPTEHGILLYLSFEPKLH